MTCDKTKNEATMEKDKDWFQILAIVLACVSSATTGMLYSWSSPSIPKIVEDKVNYNITLDEASYFTVLPPVGAIVSSFLFAKLNDSIGRKYTLLLITLPHIVSLTIISTASSVYLLYASRFITGFGDACLFSSLPVYVGEIATPKIRGSWGNFITFNHFIGQLTINIIGSYISVSTSASLCLVFPVFFFCSFMFMPETPYFHLMKGRMEEARKSLQTLRRRVNVDEELQKLKSDVNRQMSESGTWKDLFTIRSNRKAIYAGVFLRASQQMGGSSVFAVYTQYIFLKAGGNVAASTSSIIFMALCASLNLCAAFTLDRIGRRRSYFLSSLLCGCTLMIEAVYFGLDQFYSLEGLNWIPLSGMILFVFFYSFGLGIVPTLMLGELFSTSIKGKGLILLNIVYGILLSTVTKLFHLLDTTFGLFSPFLLFSLSCFISSGLALFFVPETKGKSLEEIQQTLKRNKTEEKGTC